MATVIAKSIKPIKSNIYDGIGQTEFNRHGSQVYKSNPVLITSDTAPTLFHVPGNSLILKAWIHVTTAFDASGTSAAATATISVPNDTGTEVIYDAANLGLQSTGSHPSTTEGVVVPASGGDITASFDPATATAGQFEVYLELVQPENLL